MDSNRDEIIKILQYEMVLTYNHQQCDEILLNLLLTSDLISIVMHGANLFSVI